MVIGPVSRASKTPEAIRPRCNIETQPMHARECTSFTGAQSAFQGGLSGQKACTHICTPLGTVHYCVLRTKYLVARGHSCSELPRLCISTYLLNILTSSRISTGM